MVSFSKRFVFVHIKKTAGVSIEKALADFDRSIRLNTKNAAAYHSRAIIYNKLGDNEQAIDDATSAIALDDHFASAYVTRGRALKELTAGDVSARGTPLVACLVHHIDLLQVLARNCNSGSVENGSSRAARRLQEARHPEHRPRPRSVKEPHLDTPMHYAGRAQVLDRREPHAHVRLVVHET